MPFGHTQLFQKRLAKVRKHYIIKRVICKKGGSKMDRDKALWIYQKMNERRHLEEEVRRTFGNGEIPGSVHLYAGEEAVGRGVMAQLDDTDYITRTHRGHGHAIAKGCDIKGTMAEIMGKKDGLGGGKGGSMHVADVERGMRGANGRVGGGYGI